MSDLTTLDINLIRIPNRIRQDVGDVRGLAASMKGVGLLHPVVVTPDHRLVSGARRLAAARLLGWDTVPVHVVENLTSAVPLLIAERDENVERKAFTPEEAVRMGRALEPLENAAAKTAQETGGKRKGKRGGKKAIKGGSTCPKQKEQERKPRAKDKVASAVGMTRNTYAKAEEVVSAAEAEPERFQPLVDRMNATGKVDRAHKQLRKEQSETRKNTPPPDFPAIADRYRIVQADILDGLPEVEDASVDCILTDPPYPREYLPLYEALAKTAARVLRPGGSCIVMCGQSYLPEVLALMTPLLRYHWTTAYMTPGGQSAQLWERKVNTFWKPVLWFVQGEYAGDWIGDVARSEPNDNDKQHHHWGQSESGIADLVRRFTSAGDLILDPFCGGGTTAVVALATDRRVIGADCDEIAVRTTLDRIAAQIGSAS